MHLSRLPSMFMILRLFEQKATCQRLKNAYAYGTLSSFHFYSWRV